ncbi:hypothetical protein OIU76_003816 [Salix suchowensis]|nr:hypothetical protein OIU76_003816 [Salix suchowensis]
MFKVAGGGIAMFLIMDGFLWLRVLGDFGAEFCRFSLDGAGRTGAGGTAKIIKMGDYAVHGSKVSQEVLPNEFQS